jgi:hypothetical protein
VSMRRTAAVIGTAIFFVFVPCVVAGVVPWWISHWEFRLSFLGVELTRFVGSALILAGVSGFVDSFGRFALQGLSCSYLGGIPACIRGPCCRRGGRAHSRSPTRAQRRLPESHSPPERLPNEQWRCPLDLQSSRNVWACWWFMPCPEKRTSARLWPVAFPPCGGHFHCGVCEGLLRASSFKGLSKGTGRT